MPRKAVVHEDDYPVADGVVRVTVVVGERQYGTSLLVLDDDVISNGDIEEIPLGAGPKIDGMTATVYTMVTDIRDNTDDMSVSWILTGGKKKLVATEAAAPPKEFGSQMFKGIFHFSAGKKKGRH